MAEGIKRITRSKTGCLPEAKQNRTNLLDFIANVSPEQATGK